MNDDSRNSIDTISDLLCPFQCGKFEVPGHCRISQNYFDSIAQNFSNFIVNAHRSLALNHSWVLQYKMYINVTYRPDRRTYKWGIVITHQSKFLFIMPFIYPSNAEYRWSIIAGTIASVVIPIVGIFIFIFVGRRKDLFTKGYNM